MRALIGRASSGAGPFISIGAGALMTGAAVIWADQVGPIFFYGGIALIVLGIGLWVLGRLVALSADESPAGDRVESKSKVTANMSLAAKQNGQGSRIIQAQNYYEHGAGTPPPAAPAERRKTIRREADKTPPVPSFQRLALIDVKEEVVTFGDGAKAIKAELVQVWFQSVDPDHTVAQVSADVTVEYPHQDIYAGRGPAKWAIGTEPSNMAGWTGLANKVTLAPREVGKLNVFVHQLGANACHIFNDDDRPDSIYRDNERGDYDVEIKLNGIEYERIFRFKLVFRGSTLSLNPQGR